MKRVLTFLIILPVILTLVDAQNIQKQSALNLNTGFSLVKPASSLFLNLSKTIVNAIDTSYNKYVKSLSVNSYPAIQLYYDRSIHARKKISISIGGSISYQSLELKLYHYSYKDPILDIRKSEDVIININRWNFAIRGLIHYGVSENTDFYSGIRLGWTHWALEATTTDILFDKWAYLKFGADQFAPQIILLGIRSYLSKCFGLNTEFCVGSPAFWSFGLSFKF